MKKKRERMERMRHASGRYPRVIEWSEEDGCYVGSAPPLIGQCCHGETEAEVAAQLAAIVDDLVQDVIDGRMPEPKIPSSRRYSGKFVVRIPVALHKKVALKAMARGASLNQFIAETLERA